VNPELEAYHQQFEAITQEAGELVRGLSEEEFNWRPAPGQWSIEECVAHLTMTGHWQTEALERAIDENLGETHRRNTKRVRRVWRNDPATKGGRHDRAAGRCSPERRSALCISLNEGIESTALR
jgi:NTP pyrophosphatase (non-canonical NTP hydrolase)